MTTPTLVESLLNDPVRAISSGGNHCIVITKSNKIYVWGTGRNGRLGTGNSDHKFSPYVLTFLLPKKNSNFIVNDVCCGWSHTLVYFKPEIPTEKESLSYIFAFGKADMGQCGICASDVN